jgi:integrase
VGELLDRWLELASEDFSPKTTREVSGYIERNLRPALGDVRLSKLTTASLDRYYQQLLIGGGQNGRPLAPGTIRRIHGILRRALAQGVRWGWLGVNPAASASPPRVPAPDIAPPTPDELGCLQRSIAADDPELAMFVRLSAMTGARRSEMLALRWPDIDLEAGVVTISRGIVMGPNGLVEKDTKTHQARRVALDGDTTRRLVEHQTVAAERAEAWVPAWPTSGSCSPPTSKVASRGIRTRCRVDSAAPSDVSGSRVSACTISATMWRLGS